MNLMKAVKRLARQKKGEEPSAGAPWLNTFADLMNLLLCFFVVLFAFSSVDAEKYEQVAASFANNFSIFKGGGSAINEGQLISTGIKQMNNLGEYEDTMGEASKETGENLDSDSEINMKLMEEKKKFHKLCMINLQICLKSIKSMIIWESVLIRVLIM